MTHVPYNESLFSGSVTGNGNTQSTPIITRWVKEGIFFVDITALGSSTTLTITLKTYNTLADKWHKMAVWDGFASTGTDEVFIGYGLGDKMSITYSFSGGTTTATFSVNAHLKEF